MGPNEQQKAVSLPERDATKPAEQQGLFRKFDVRRTDGSSEPGGKHENCEYFVLDTDHDPNATAALVAYANSVEATHPELAADMRNRYALPKPEPVGKVDHGCYRDTKWLRQPAPSIALLYTESPITPPASEQKPIAWVTTNEDGDYAMLFFDQQEARSYSGDDEPIGLAPVSASALLPEQENYKAQRDALLEELEKAAVAFWKLDNADIHAQEAESAIALVKGGA